MDDAIRYFRGEFTKGKATIFDYIKDLICTADDSRYIINMYKFIQRILLLISSTRNTPTVYGTIMARKAKKLIGPHGTV